MDPDLGVDVVDMSFVRAVEVDGEIARLTMTLTSPVCPTHRVSAASPDSP
ncbi:iron-sulfur cluster assembly protein [Pseudonocardia ammonioxydans]|nr:iron-sulfur cluster assembly protein [Pseudonocardia ammonioxydans]